MLKQNPRSLSNFITNKHMLKNYKDVSKDDFPGATQALLVGNGTDPDPQPLVDIFTERNHPVFSLIGARLHYKNEIVLASSPGDMDLRIKRVWQQFNEEALTFRDCTLILDEASDPYWLDLITHWENSRILVLRNPNFSTLDTAELGICAGNRLVYMVMKYYRPDVSLMDKVFRLSAMPYCWLNPLYNFDANPADQPDFKNHNHIFYLKDGVAVLTRTDYLLAYRQLREYVLRVNPEFKENTDLLQSWWPSPLHKLKPSNRTEQELSDWLDGIVPLIPSPL